MRIIIQVFLGHTSSRADSRGGAKIPLFTQAKNVTEVSETRLVLSTIELQQYLQQWLH